MLGVGVYDSGKLIGLAACSADCDTMWQIGIDVLTEYRRKGIAVFAKRKGRFPYEVSLVPEHVAKRNVKDPLYFADELDGFDNNSFLSKIFIIKLLHVI